MSKNNALETAALNWFKGVGSLPNAWRVQPVIASTAMETDGFTVPSYSGYAALSVADSEMTVSGNSLVINVDKLFAAVAGSQIDVERFVLEASTDGGSTWPLKYYSDTDLNTVVAVGVQPKLPANTGFSATED